MIKTPESDKDRILREFMQENFPYSGFKQMGFFTKEMRGDYKAQAERVRSFFGYETVFEYGKEEIRCHISYAGGRPLQINEDGELKEEPFITIIPSLYD